MWIWRRAQLRLVESIPQLYNFAEEIGPTPLRSRFGTVPRVGVCLNGPYIHASFVAPRLAERAPLRSQWGRGGQPEWSASILWRSGRSAPPSACPLPHFGPRIGGMVVKLQTDPERSRSRPLLVLANRGDCALLEDGSAIIIHGECSEEGGWSENASKIHWCAQSPSRDRAAGRFD